MTRLHRHIVAGALLGGAMLMSIAPAHAEAGLRLTEAEPTTAHIDGSGIVSSGSADFLTAGSSEALSRMWCGTLWQPVCH
ncbi:hypothetical protein [Nocardia cyriacigeorgica]|uniref:Uncharacterized protein n=1 Tax=Nocardia cyriacigeorgica TaxID=135487 RepID=A0A5R8NJL7_9NOCA|nr:hypothetical protein [Nocardia cyriacigeorgica]TLF75841.1 hypothetical protein FEK34_18910 [Nocardia cyriacigeorgica]